MRPESRVDTPLDLDLDLDLMAQPTALQETLVAVPRESSLTARSTPSRLERRVVKPLKCLRLYPRQSSASLSQDIVVL
jgi:hypothetical protein